MPSNNPVPPPGHPVARGTAGTPSARTTRHRRWPWVVGTAAVLVAVAAGANGAGHATPTGPTRSASDEVARTETRSTPGATSPAPTRAPHPSATVAPVAPVAPVVPTAPDPRPTGAQPTGTPATGKPAPGTAAAALALLPVKGRAPMTGYSRAEFGPAWADVDRNGCDTRNDVLARDLTHRTTKPGTHGCVVASGTLPDPYSGTAVAFVRGVGTSSAVQIDHVVALGDAWQKGAQKLSPAVRERLANDPLNLLAADGHLNQSKSDGDAATWPPPNKAFRCQYVARQVAVKQAYGLWVTRAEHDAIARVLATCPGQRLPDASTRPVVHVTGAAPAPARPTSPVRPVRPASPKAPTSGGTHPAVAAPVSRTDCPSWAPIKGNASSHIYHLPGGAFYDRTNPEVCFATPAAAEADGYRASKR